MRTHIAILVGSMVAGCNTSQPPSPSAPTSGDQACTLYDKSIVGWTMKRAVFKSEMVGGTIGDKQLSEREPPQRV